MNARTWVCTIILFIAGLAQGVAEQESLQIRDFRDIAVHADGSIYVLDNANDGVLKLDKEGRQVWWAPLAVDNGRKSNPYGLTLAQRAPDFLYVISTVAGVRDISSDGKVGKVFPPPLSQTDGISSVDAMGQVYYLDRQHHLVKKYQGTTGAVTEPAPEDKSNAGDSAADTPKFSDGTPDRPSLVIDGKVEGPAHFGDPYEVCVDGQGNIWVLGNNYIYKVFDSQGRFLREIKAPDAKNRSFTYVVGMESDAEGNTYLACQETKIVLKYDKEGNLINDIKTGIWASAFGLDQEGRLYVADTRYRGPDGTHTPAIKVLDQSGNLLRTIIVEQK